MIDLCIEINLGLSFDQALNSFDFFFHLILVQNQEMKYCGIIVFSQGLSLGQDDVYRILPINDITFHLSFAIEMLK